MATIREAVEGEDEAGVEQADPFEHKLIRRLLPDYLAELEQARAKQMELAAKIKASYHFAIATNDDQRQPDAKDKLRNAFAGAAQPVKIEVYQGCQHGWCVSDGMVDNKSEADRAFGALVALYATTLA